MNNLFTIYRRTVTKKEKSIGKALIIFFFALCLIMPSLVRSQTAFTAGNLVVERVGDGSTSLSGTSAPISFIEYTTSGSLVQTISTTSLTVSESGSAPTAGHLTLSADGTTLVFVGYGTAAGTASVTSSTVNRKVGFVSKGGSPSIATYFTGNGIGSSAAYDANNFRAAYFDGTTIWASGNDGATGSGVHTSTVTNGGAASPNVSIITSGVPALTSTAGVYVYKDQLYVTSVGSGTANQGLFSIGSGKPTTTGQSGTSVQVLSTSTPYEAILLNTGNTNPGQPDLMYLTNTTHIFKYYWSGSAWVAAGSASDAVNSLVAHITTSGNVSLYGVEGQGTSTSYIVKFVDGQGRTGSISTGSLTPTTIVTGTSDYEFTGISWVPSQTTSISASNYASTLSTGNLSSGNYGDITIPSGVTATLTGNINVNGTLTVQSGGTLICGNYFVFSPEGSLGTFDLKGGGTLETQNDSGIYQYSNGGSIQTATRFYETGANYIYDGSVAQNTGDGLSQSASVASLTINNSSGVSVTNNITVTGAITVSSGANLMLTKSRVISGSGSITFASGSNLTTNNVLGVGSGNNAGIQLTGGVSYSPTMSFAFTLNSASQVTGTDMPTSVTNLTVSNSMGVTLSQNTTTTGSTTVSAGGLLIVAAANTLGGAVTNDGTIEVTATGNSDDLAAQYTGTLTTSSGIVNFAGAGNQHLTSTINPTGFVISNTGGTVTFAANQSPTGSPGTTVNSSATLIVSSGNTLGGSLTNNGTIDVTTTGTGHDLTSQYTGTLTTSGGTVNFAGASNQTLASTISVTNFVISNTSGTVTFSASETVSGSTTINSVATLIVTASSVLSGGITNNGTIEVTATGNANDLTTQYTGTISTSSGNINFAGSGNQTLASTISPANFVISNTAGTVTFSVSETPGTGTTVNSNAILILTASSTLSGTLADNGTIEVTANGNSNDLTSQYAGTLTLSSGTVDFAGASAQQIGAESLYNLSLNNSSGLTLNGGVTVTGMIMISAGNINLNSNTLTTTGASAMFNGSGAQSTGSWFPSSIVNLTLNNSGGLTLTNPLTVTGILTLSSGKITLGANKLTLSSGASIGGSPGSSNYIYINGAGALEVTATTSSFLLPIGDDYNPITIQATSGTGVFDISIADDITDASNNPTFTNDVVNRTWSLNYISGTATSIQVTPQWTDPTDITGSFDETNVLVASRTSLTSAWSSTQTSTPATSLGGGVYSLLSGNINVSTGNDYYIGVGSGNIGVNPLPVSLMTFNANDDNGKVDLKWTTASEQNNNYFDIERSMNAANWANIGKVDGHGTTQIENNYLFTDPLTGVIPSGDIYYRLKQVDFNGNYAYSNISAVQLQSVQNSIYPNPASSVMNINLVSGSQGNAIITLVDMNGKLVQSSLEPLSAGNNVIKIDLSNVPFGNYLVKIITPSSVECYRVMRVE